jgi:hypothetical protein
VSFAIFLLFQVIVYFLQLIIVLTFLEDALRVSLLDKAFVVVLFDKFQRIFVYVVLKMAFVCLRTIHLVYDFYWLLIFKGRAMHGAHRREWIDD